MRTDVPMFTSEDAAAAWSQPLPASQAILAGEAGWKAARDEVCDAVEDERLRDVAPDDDWLCDQVRKSVADAVAQEWVEGLSMDEWASRARLRLTAQGAARREDDEAAMALVLVRSDAGDGGWSLHAAGATDEQIADGSAPPVLAGIAIRDRRLGGAWTGPTLSDRFAALRRLRGREGGAAP